MAEYKVALDDMNFLLKDVFKVADDWEQMPSLQERIDIETAQAILEEAAKLTEDLIAPNARAADEIGVKLEAGQVVTPKGYIEQFQALAEGGWVGLTAPPEYGGMGLPKVLSAQYEEMMCAADVAFSLYSGLTVGAIISLDAHADDFLKDTFIPKMAQGKWTGTMCLTEPHAGTDLGMIKTRAVPTENNKYLITGTKIFITGGDHDLAENIIHLVLAKLPDAPAGTRGISLFLVPKFKLNAANEVGERNKVSVGSLEHKMGIHSSATCVMNFDGAEGWLVGEPNKGLAAMFTMMNYERLGVGIQGLGAAARSYGTALAYAKERIQGRGAQATRDTQAPADPLLVHGDIRRMLLTMKAFIEGSRAFSTYVGSQLDKAKYAADAATKEKAQALVELLTPVAKAFITDVGFEATIHGQQILGGHGYIREWGQEQLVRDSRIAQIYEGTNGIQALDLLGRKVVGSQGKLLIPLVEEISVLLSEAPGIWKPQFEELAILVQEVERITQEIFEQLGQDENIVNSVAVEYLQLIGYVVFAWLWLKMAKTAEASAYSEHFKTSKQKTAIFYFERILPRVYGLMPMIEAGSKALFSFHENEL